MSNTSCCFATVVTLSNPLWRNLLDLRQRGSGLQQPESHVHSVVQRYGGRQRRVRLLPLASCHVQGTETQVTVGLERVHAECLGQGLALLVVGFSLCGIGGIGVGMDNAKLVQRERLVPTCLLLPGQVERLVRVLPGFLAASRPTTDLAEPCVGIN
jgi:hypothetical protein